MSNASLYTSWIIIRIGVCLVMRGVGAALILFVWLGCTLLVGMSAAGSDRISLYNPKQSPSEGPTIEWYETAGNETVVLAWDGAYTGQTEEVWTHSAWVNDSDGVDCVIFRYRWIGDTEWTNRTAKLIEGNATLGHYEANFTYAVWWNYDWGYPETEGGGGNFYFKIWANDTLGNWNEAGPMQYMGGYMLVHPPFDYILWRTPIGWAVVGTIIVITSAFIVFLARRRT
jgi:hypothetical protein